MIRKIKTTIPRKVLGFSWVALAVLPGTVLPAAAEEQYKVSSLLWQVCDDAPDIECARLPVPVDWNNPQGEKIELSLVRQLASNADAAPTLLLGAGGPGGSGVEDMKSGIWSKDLEHLKIKGLVNAVSWDSRGIGESSPVICDRDRPGKIISLNNDITDEELAAAREQNRSHVQGCREKSGLIFDYVDTLSDVRDMEAIRVALGLDKLNYLGVSYGSVRGQQYVSKYPQKTGRFVLDSVFDHSVKGLKAYAELVVQEPERKAQVFFDWCTVRTGCAFHGVDGDALLAELYEKAEKGELIDPDTQQGITVRGLAQFMAGTRAPGIGYFEDIANRLASLAGHLPTNSNAFSVVSVVPEKESPFKPRADYLDAYDAITCSDWGAYVNTAREIHDIRAGLPLAAPRTKALRLWMPTPLQCEGWPPPTNPPAPVSFDGAPQVMIVSALGDGQTGYDWGLSLAKKTNTPLLTYGGSHHVTYQESTCTASYIRDYLLDGIQINKDTFCPNEKFDYRPFVGQPGEVKAEISKMSLTEARSGVLIGYNKSGLILPPGKNRFVVRMGLNNGAIGRYVDTTTDTGMLKIQTNPYQGPGVYKIVLATTDGSATAQGNVDVGTPIYVTVTPDS